MTSPVARFAIALAVVACASLSACSKSDVDSAQTAAQNAIASAAPGLASALPQAKTEATIYAKIEARFAEIDPASTFHVLVTVKTGGAVQLSGAVRSADTQKRFVAAANGVQGVTSVASTVTIDPSLPNTVQGARDFGVEALVRAKLVQDAGMNGVHVTVTARSGKVILLGDVKTQAIADTLVAAAKRAKGVTQVESKLVVR